MRRIRPTFLPQKTPPPLFSFGRTVKGRGWIHRDSSEEKKSGKGGEGGKEEEEEVTDGWTRESKYGIHRKITLSPLYFLTFCTNIRCIFCMFFSAFLLIGEFPSRAFMAFCSLGAVYCRYLVGGKRGGIPLDNNALCREERRHS